MAAWSRVFWLTGGWLLGVATATGLLAFVASGLGGRGVVVPVAVGRVTENVQGEVEAAVLAEIPHTVQALKQQVPERVAAEIRRRLEDGSFRLGDLPISLPPGLLGPAFDDQVEATVSSALDQLVADDETGSAARTIAVQVSDLVRHRLAAEVTDWRVTLHPWRYLSVPVTLRPEP